MKGPEEGAGQGSEDEMEAEEAREVQSEGVAEEEDVEIPVQPVPEGGQDEETRQQDVSHANQLIAPGSYRGRLLR